MIASRDLAVVVILLGVTQIVGYGSVFYSYAILAPDIAVTFAVSGQWVFGVLSVAFLASSVAAPWVGAMADKAGAGRLLVAGSVACAVALAAAGLAPSALLFGLAIVVTQAASRCVTYQMAFTAIVQAGGPSASRGIVYLTLIAGFASTIFWPLTTWLQGQLDWRWILMLFAAMNLTICMPLHAWIASLSRRRVAPPPEAVAERPSVPPVPPVRDRTTFVLMLAGFAAEGFVITCVLVHLVPLTHALGLGAAGLWVASLFGPAQVASRLINMMFGGRLKQVWLAVIAAGLLPVGILLLMATTPWLPGAIVFVALFGLSSGLNSIIGGTLPLELFGHARFGAMAGWAASARQFAAAFSPFALSAMLAATGVMPSLSAMLAAGLVGLAAFLAIAIRRRGR